MTNTTPPNRRLPWHETDDQRERAAALLARMQEMADDYERKATDERRTATELQQRSGRSNVSPDLRTQIARATVRASLYKDFAVNIRLLMAQTRSATR